jgi:hypothetical protein
MGFRKRFFGLFKELYDLVVACCGGEARGRPAVCGLPANVGASLQEEPYNVRATIPTGPHQGRLAANGGRIDVRAGSE